MKILFICQQFVPFIQKDLEILRSAHEVRAVTFTGRKGLMRNIFPDFFRLWHGVLWCDMTFSWFGKLHAFFAVLFCKILNKKSVVVSGGDEVENCFIDGKKWGLCSHPLKRLFPLFVFRYADLILTHSEYNHNSTLNNAKSPPGRTLLIYHGFDKTIFKPDNKIRREDLTITVGRIDNEHLYRKGHKLFVESACYLPEMSYSLVGPVGEKSAYQFLLDLAPNNVSFEGGLYGDDLVTKFEQAKVYVQASECESFACALAEAMLCGCIPVVSKLGALPEVVGECGFYIDKFEPQELAEKIQLALANPQMSQKARERIARMFPLARRKEELLKAISSLDTQREK